MISSFLISIPILSKEGIYHYCSSSIEFQNYNANVDHQTLLRSQFLDIQKYFFKDEKSNSIQDENLLLNLKLLKWRHYPSLDVYIDSRNPHRNIDWSNTEAILLVDWSRIHGLLCIESATIMGNPFNIISRQCKTVSFKPYSAMLIYQSWSRIKTVQGCISLQVNSANQSINQNSKYGVFDTHTREWICRICSFAWLSDSFFGFLPVYRQTRCSLLINRH